MSAEPAKRRLVKKRVAKKKAAAVYGPRPLKQEAKQAKRKRRTKAEIAAIDDGMMDLVEEEQPMTVRQIFYRMVAAGIIDKAEKNYKLVCRRLKLLRKGGRMPFDWIVDNTRWMRKPTTHTGMMAALVHTYQCYRRSLWSDSPVYV